MWKYISVLHSKSFRHPILSLIAVAVIGAIAMVTAFELLRKGYNKDQLRKSLQKKLHEETNRHPVGIRFAEALAGAALLVLIWTAAGLLPFRVTDERAPHAAVSPDRPVAPPAQQKKDTIVPVQSSATGRPTFTESRDELVVLIGGTPHKIGEANTRKHPANVAPFGDARAIQAYIERGRIFIDSSLHYSPDRPPLELIHNELRHRPPEWDRNFDQSAIEIVDAKLIPRFQLIYKDARTVELRGVFQFPGGAVVLEDKARFFIGSVEDSIRIARLFKYPSRLHQGEELSVSQAPVISQQG